MAECYLLYKWVLDASDLLLSLLNSPGSNMLLLFKKKIYLEPRTGILGWIMESSKLPSSKLEEHRQNTVYHFPVTMYNNNFYLRS